jgi:hypothetical protein
MDGHCRDRPSTDRTFVRHIDWRFHSKRFPFRDGWWPPPWSRRDRRARRIDERSAVASMILVPPHGEATWCTTTFSGGQQLTVVKVVTHLLPMTMSLSYQRCKWRWNDGTRREDGRAEQQLIVRRRRREKMCHHPASFFDFCEAARPALVSLDPFLLRHRPSSSPFWCDAGTCTASCRRCVVYHKSGASSVPTHHIRT